MYLSIYYILISHKNENLSEEQDRSYLDPKLAGLKQPRKVSSLEIVNSKAFKNSTIKKSQKTREKKPVKKFVERDLQKTKSTRKISTIFY